MVYEKGDIEDVDFFTRQTVKKRQYQIPPPNKKIVGALVMIWTSYFLELSIQAVPITIKTQLFCCLDICVNPNTIRS